MKFSCACPDCERANDVEWSRIGRQIDCDGCGKPFVVPAPMEIIERPEKTRDLIRFRCPACGKKYSTSGKLVGQKIRCKGCGGGVRVPGVEASPTPSEAHSIPMSSSSLKKCEPEAPSSELPELPVPASPDDSESSLFELPADLIAPPTTTRPGAAGHSPGAERGTPLRSTPGAATADSDTRIERAASPRSQAPPPADDRGDDDHESVDDAMPILQDTDVLDIKRKIMREAVLSSRSEAMERVSREVAEEQARIDQQKRRLALQRATLKKKKKKGAYFDTKETLRLVGWVTAFVGATAFLAWGYPELRFPVGGMICIIGFIVYLLGWGALKQHVAEEGALRAIAFRFIPPYQWWYVWSRWSETRDYALFFLAGMIMTSIGVAIIKTSPNGMKAERNEQIYQKSLKDNEARLNLP